MNSLTKVCPKCNIEKDVSEFVYGNKKRSCCTPCEKAEQKRYRETHRDVEDNRNRRYVASHPEKVKARNHKYQAENREKIRETTRQWIAKNPEKWKNNVRKSILKKKYGITPEQYDGMLRRQGGVCSVCGKPPGKRKLSVDHNHKTGKVRSLLCTRCNMALGYTNESPSILQGLIDYLKRHL